MADPPPDRADLQRKRKHGDTDGPEEDGSSQDPFSHPGPQELHRSLLQGSLLANVSQGPLRLGSNNSPHNPTASQLLSELQGQLLQHSALAPSAPACQPPPAHRDTARSLLSFQQQQHSSLQLAGHQGNSPLRAPNGLPALYSAADLHLHPTDNRMPSTTFASHLNRSQLGQLSSQDASHAGTAMLLEQQRSLLNSQSLVTALEQAAQKQAQQQQLALYHRDVSDLLTRAMASERPRVAEPATLLPQSSLLGGSMSVSSPSVELAATLNAVLQRATEAERKAALAMLLQQAARGSGGQFLPINLDPRPQQREPPKLARRLLKEELLVQQVLEIHKVQDREVPETLLCAKELMASTGSFPPDAVIPPPGVTPPSAAQGDQEEGGEGDLELNSIKAEMPNGLADLFGLRPTRKSRYRGVEWDRSVGKWRARITHQGKKLSLGSFVSEQEAARTYNDMAKRLKGHAAQLNDVPEGVPDPPLPPPEPPAPPEEEQVMSKSGFRGVTWDRRENRWRARITYQGKHKAIGRYCTEYGAALAYDKMAIVLLGDRARTNFDKKLVTSMLEQEMQEMEGGGDAVPAAAAQEGGENGAAGEAGPTGSGDESAEDPGDPRSPLKQGVSWDKRDQRWRARISVEGKQKHIGRFPTQEAAAAEYNDAALKVLSTHGQEEEPGMEGAGHQEPSIAHTAAVQSMLMDARTQLPAASAGPCSGSGSGVMSSAYAHAASAEQQHLMRQAVQQERPNDAATLLAALQRVAQEQLPQPARPPADASINSLLLCLQQQQQQQGIQGSAVDAGGPPGLVRHLSGVSQGQPRSGGELRDFEALLNSIAGGRGTPSAAPPGAGAAAANQQQQLLQQLLQHLQHQQQGQQRQAALGLSSRHDLQALLSNLQAQLPPGQLPPSQQQLQQSDAQQGTWDTAAYMRTHQQGNWQE